jgi:hypothetical protein
MFCQNAAPIWLPFGSCQYTPSHLLQSIITYALAGLEVNLCTSHKISILFLQQNSHHRRGARARGHSAQMEEHSRFPACLEFWRCYNGLCRNLLGGFWGWKFCEIWEPVAVVEGGWMNNVAVRQKLFGCGRGTGKQAARASHRAFPVSAAVAWRGVGQSKARSDEWMDFT